MSVIGFLHTSPVHVATFDALVADASRSAETGAVVQTMAIVNEGLLGMARRDGLESRAVRRGVRDAIVELRRRGADLVICTCSTIGEIAATAGVSLGYDVSRVDRPMAEEAVRLASAGAGRIAIVVALESTVAPTLALIESIASGLGASQWEEIDLHVVVSEAAWPLFEAGDIEGYLDAIASTCAECPVGIDVIVLAQASMADAASRFDGAVPVLSSPASAVNAALARLSS